MVFCFPNNEKSPPGLLLLPVCIGTGCVHVNDVNTLRSSEAFFSKACIGTCCFKGKGESEYKHVKNHGEMPWADGQTH